MAKIFRLHSGDGMNQKHWFSRNSPYDKAVIDNIVDPADANANTRITSIPSPFAQMDLVETAFLKVTENPEGDTIYHKMVSDALDIAQIFFNLDNLRDKIEVIEWDRNRDLNSLIQSTSVGNKLYGETLNMYLNQDSETFNFDGLDKVYLLNYKQGPDQLNIIGGTSSSNLFFASANDLSYVKIKFGPDEMLDDEYFPLHLRNEEFINYFFILKNTIPNFANKYRALNNYLDATFPLIKDEHRNGLANVIIPNVQQELANYNSLTVDQGANQITFDGVTLPGRGEVIQVDSSQNDFLIQSDKANNISAFPLKAFNHNFSCGNTNWTDDAHRKMPVHLNAAVADRLSPLDDLTPCPFITVSDILEPYLVRIPYNLERESFFDGNQGTDFEFNSFLLPLKPAFFEYFSKEDLMNKSVGGQTLFKMTRIGDSANTDVKVSLRIPLKGGNGQQFAEWERVYYNYSNAGFAPKEEEQNKGYIVDAHVSLAIFPFVKHPQGISPHYRVMLCDQAAGQYDYGNSHRLRFYSNNAEEVQIASSVTRRKRNNNNTGAYISSIENNFDFVQLSHPHYQAMLLPKMKELQLGSDEISFALDFGTTNTHVAYKINSNPIQNLTFDDIPTTTLPGNDALVLSIDNLGLPSTLDELSYFIDADFVMSEADNNKISFPFRTVIADNNEINPNATNKGLQDFNIPFWYHNRMPVEPKIMPAVTFNLKWGNFDDGLYKERVKGYLEQLFFYMRYKALQNNIQPDNINVSWFYPSSMSPFHKGNLSNIMNSFHSKYLGAGNIASIVESIAPFEYYRKDEGVGGELNINIDIGGGTSDVIVYEQNEPVLITSYRFAANDVFANGLNYTNAHNGYIAKYEKEISEFAIENSLPRLNAYFTEILNSQSPNELISFLFNLDSDYNELIPNELNWSLSERLAENNLKLPILLFYTSMIYDLIGLLKQKGINHLPNNISFSGNGSKLLDIISSDSKILKTYTQKLFERYNEQLEVRGNLGIRRMKSPKEVTCKGGIYMAENKVSVPDNITKVYYGLKNVPLADTNNCKSLNYFLEPGIKTEYVNNVKNFIQFFRDLNSSFSFEDNFGINSSIMQDRELWVGLCNEVRTYMDIGIDQLNINKQEAEQVPINYSLFFMPLKGVLNELAFQIVNKHE